METDRGLFLSRKARAVDEWIAGRLLAVAAWIAGYLLAVTVWTASYSLSVGRSRVVAVLEKSISNAL